MNQLLIFLLFTVQIWLASGASFRIRLYAGVNCTGESSEFHWEAENELECVRNLLGGALKSSVVYGYWVIGAEGDLNWNLIGDGTTNFDCVNFDSSLTSIEKMHPLGDTFTDFQAITIVPQLKSNDIFQTTGDTEALVNIMGDVTQAIIATAGTTNWTLFENNNFEGNSECLVAAQPEINFFSTGLLSIGSLVRGCADQFHSKIVLPVKHK